jgi:hypothetical protein
MTNMTNDSVIFQAGDSWTNRKIDSYLYIIYILYINMCKFKDVSGISMLK